MEEVKHKAHTTLAEKAKVVRWLNDNHEYLQTKPSFAAAARKCSEETKIPIPDKTFVYVARSFNLLWEPAAVMGGRAVGRVNELASRVEALEKQFKEVALHEDIVNLRALVQNLYVQLGAQPPKLPLPPKPSHESGPNGVK